MQYNYMTFKSVSHAMKAESVLRKNNIEFKTIPVPRSISSHCGICIRYIKDNGKIAALLDGIYENIYSEAV